MGLATRIPPLSLRERGHFSPLPPGEGLGVRAEDIDQRNASSLSTDSCVLPSPPTPLPEGEGRNGPCRPGVPGESRNGPSASGRVAIPPLSLRERGWG